MTTAKANTCCRRIAFWPAASEPVPPSNLFFPAGSAFQATTSALDYLGHCTSRTPINRQCDNSRPTSAAAAQLRRHATMCRVGHKKSRRGCMACKRRRVKVAAPPARRMALAESITNQDIDSAMNRSRAGTACGAASSAVCRLCLPPPPRYVASKICRDPGSHSLLQQDQDFHKNDRALIDASQIHDKDGEMVISVDDWMGDLRLLRHFIVTTTLEPVGATKNVQRLWRDVVSEEATRHPLVNQIAFFHMQCTY